LSATHSLLLCTHIKHAALPKQHLELTYALRAHVHTLFASGFNGVTAANRIGKKFKSVAVPHLLDA
jgi:hypothetical protein